MKMGPRLATTNWGRMALYNLPAPPKAAPAPTLVAKTPAAKPGKAAATDKLLAARFAAWAASGRVAS